MATAHKGLLVQQPQQHLQSSHTLLLPSQVRYRFCIDAAYLCLILDQFFLLILSRCTAFVGALFPIRYMTNVCRIMANAIVGCQAIHPLVYYCGPVLHFLGTRQRLCKAPRLQIVCQDRCAFHDHETCLYSVSLMAI